MDLQPDQEPSRAVNSPLRLARLLPAGEPVSVAQIIEELGLWERNTRPSGAPRVMLNMVASADGRATLAGRSGPLSGRGDRELFHGLRTAVDAVLVGAGTVRAERYGRIIKNAAHRQLRAQRGLSEEPLACVVSGRLALDADIPLLAEPAARVVILTASPASLPRTAAHVDYVRTHHDGVLDLRAGLAALGERFGVRSILCEGGPHLACQLLTDSLVDELFLTLSPTLVGGEPTGGQALRILAGSELQPARELELLGALHCDSQLFLRYGVLPRAGTGGE